MPTVLPALNNRQVAEAGRILQGSIAGARDRAIHAGTPAGIRLLPDPALVSYQPDKLPDGTPNPHAGWVDLTRPLAYSRVLPIAPAPEYRSGLVSVYPAKDYSAITVLPCVVLEQAVVDGTGLPCEPTSWFWNVRVGDKVQVGGAGPWYSVCGPMVVPPQGALVTDCSTNRSIFVANPEAFVNTGAPGCPSIYQPAGVPTEYLLLANGRDDGKMIGLPSVPDGPDGWVDSGWDGVDQDGIGGADNAGEWEREQWLGQPQGVVSARYAIRRRMAPTSGSAEVALPTHMVIDAARSQLPIDPINGSVEVAIGPDGTAAPVLPYGAPSSLGMQAAFFHFALVDRTDMGTGVGPKASWLVLSLTRDGRTVASDDPDPAAPFAWAMHGGR